MTQPVDPDRLTDEQVENWRRMLVAMIGPYALYMSREQIQQMRDRQQANVDRESEAVE